MSPLDIVIILAVAVAVVLCVRSFVRGRASECSTCGDAGCTARRDGGRCRAADDMLRRASEALDRTARPNAG
ncbi:MAG: FeoB-associated Cys-rich membrane protein [Coriobacteriaceae bacterium]|uniref:FeoB-associated Cys-rich membrane protein n=1 Tax=Tractidigestivibacter sp. TaxID=2847320 RepID=UPI002A8085D6|nr:FeoB-associated Cys-rich membrane protein [Tractidigestivibacter sp.]MCI6274764.1 FeoB-associated Cys-rich membrane protein [Coriobacteriaceae bacterium]MCI6547202.1 FeoB-associated Cys-rich membrane protein [Coriobacteriaceae bacterium]MCI6843308.1 FeoB-associated Cys-rich membrane protein [Coriobacteriaceae bacterium]MCI7438701.1 FeoB-associated Cys-rich membrane protein [Coriobacteriaceae bacterium]MDD7583570.1 FeoB-associated Cys-rich membrane protein [Coriobacteriaceae bacterium]